MKIKKLFIENFRAFENLEMDFGDRITLLVGENGSGKTSLLDSLSVVLGSVLSAFPDISGISFKKGDIHQEDNKSSLFTQVSVETRDGITWGRMAKKFKGAVLSRENQRRSGLQQLKWHLEESVLEPWRNGTDFIMPVFSYYGVSRALLEVPLRRRGFPKSYERFEALENSLNATSRFKSAFIWFYIKENEEIRKQKELKSWEYKLPELEAVRQAIGLLFPGISDPHILVNPLKFAVKFGNEILDIIQLSDGYKTLLSLVIDLASRMALANPQMLNPLEAESIVMIDEIDLHLHPEWQARVVGDLLRAFPNTQFIITTHSPFIVESINNHLQRFKIGESTIKDTVIQNILPVSPDSVKAYSLQGSKSSSLLDLKSGLLDDRLIPPYNKIARTFDTMRDIEWESKSHD